jgi:hypothetical protein
MTDIRDSLAESAQPRRKRPARLVRALFWLGGFNPERLERCPADERAVAIRTALSLIVVFLFGAIGVATALSIAFATDGPTPMILFVAGLAGLALALFDHAVVQTLWAARGRGAAHERGLASPESTWAARMREAVAGLVYGLSRAFVTLAGAYAIGTTILLVVFQSDISDRIAADDRSANAQILQRAETAVAERVAARAAEVERLTAAVATATEAHRAVAAKLAEQQLAAEDQRRRRIAELEDERQKNLRSVQEHETNLAAELRGVKLDNRTSGVAGRGLLYDFAVSQAQLHRTRAQELEVEILQLRGDSGQAVFAEAQERVDREADRLRAREADLARAIAERDSLSSGRVAAAAAMAAEDPAFQRTREGLLARLKAFATIAADPAVSTYVLAVKGWIIGLDLLALLVAHLSRALSVYGVRTATETETDAAEATAEALVRRDALDEAARVRRAARADAESRDARERWREGARQAVREELRVRLKDADRRFG